METGDRLFLLATEEPTKTSRCMSHTAHCHATGTFPEHLLLGPSSSSTYGECGEQVCVFNGSSDISSSFSAFVLIVLEPVLVCVMCWNGPSGDHG